MTPQTTVPTRRRFTVEEYHQMAEAGILREDDRVELIDGEIIQMPPVGGPHAGHINRFARRLWRAFDDVAIITVQNPVHLNDENEPEPDIALVKLRDDEYTGSHPTPVEIYVLIEVADSSVVYDRRVKALLYAQANIPEYLLLDLTQMAIIVLRDPTPEGYASAVTLHRGDQWAPLAFPDRAIAVTDTLGEA